MHKGWMSLFSHENLVDVLTYLALCNNHFSTSTRFRQKSIGNGFRKEVIQTSFALCLVLRFLAEIPDSIRQHFTTFPKKC